MESIIVFTAKSAQTMFRQGGCGYWSLNAERARKCEYVLMTANAHSRDTEHATQDHGRGFLIARISGVRAVQGVDFGESRSDRWLIEFSEYAHISVPDVWPGTQNPVRYLSHDLLDVNVTAVEWKPFSPEKIEVAEGNVTPLSIEEAKRGLGKKFGVPPECIEITIRG